MDRLGDCIEDVAGWLEEALAAAASAEKAVGHPVNIDLARRELTSCQDLGGGITGAQAGLYTRAKDALEQCLPLLDGLYPLDPEADQEYVKALREMARSQMSEIIKELGALGGPSVLRVNTYFQILLGQNQLPVTFDLDKVKGTLGSLRDTYGVSFTDNPFSNSIRG